MHRWITRLVGFWLTLFVPSVVGWGVLVRWNDAGPRRFERAWRWCAHLATIPLIVRPLTDRCWNWLDHDGGLLAVLGFGLLVSLWCLMIALPASVVWVWADWLGRRLDPTRSYVGGGSSGAYDPYALPSTASDSSARNALYLIMIPLALLWHTGRWLLRAVPGILVIAVIVWVLRFIYLLIRITNGDSFAFLRRIDLMDRAWHGYLGHLGMHRLFGDMWRDQFIPSQQLAHATVGQAFEFSYVIDHLGSYSYVIKLCALDAAMHGLIIGVVVGGDRARRQHRLAPSLIDVVRERRVTWRRIYRWPPGRPVPCYRIRWRCRMPNIGG